MRRIPLALFHLSMWHLRWLKRIAIACMLLALILACIWQFWMVPRLNEYRSVVAQELQQKIGVPVQIARVEGGWSGLRPRVAIFQMSLGQNAAQPDLSFSRLDASLSWWHLLLGQIQFRQIILTAPDVELRRRLDGRWQVGGIVMDATQSKNPNLVNWLLAQNEVRVRQGQLNVLDEQGHFPPLHARDVNFFSDQFFNQHRFEASFTPPAAMGGQIKVEGRLKGADIAQLQQWSGWAKLIIPDSNLAQIAPWLNGLWPKLNLESGQGRLALKVELEQGRIQSLEADVGMNDWRVSDTSTTYSLPKLDARVFWADTGINKTLRIDGADIVSASGTLCQSCELAYSQTPQGSHLDMRRWQLAGVNAYWPLLQTALPPQLLSRLLAQQTSAPQGALSNRILPTIPLTLTGAINQANLTWQGDWRQPKNVSGEVAMEAFSLLHPALKIGPVTATMQFKPQGGRLDLSGQGMLLNYPAQLLEALTFAQWDSRLEWQKNGDDWRIDLVKLAVANSDVQLKLAGLYQGPSSGDGQVKLAGDIGHLAANKVYAYLPRILGDDVLTWLRRALPQGDASNGKIIWEGRVMDFPYTAGSVAATKGQFKISAQAKGVTLDYVEGWPALHQIAGDLTFAGLAMDVRAKSAEISGATLYDVSAKIPNLETEQHVLIDGKARGKTSDFLRFVQNSPVKTATNGFLDQLSAEGNGELALQLDIPIEDTDATKVKGKYQFKQNVLLFGGVIPKLSEATGSVEFTESALSIPAANAKALGGKVTLQGANDAQGALLLALKGEAAMEQVATQYMPALQGRIQGLSAFQAQLKVSPQHYDLNIQSDLYGAKIDLPPPMAKNAGQLSALQLKATGGKAADRLTFSYDKQLTGSLLQQGNEPLRLVVALGSEARPLPEKGILITGAWPQVRLDEWLSFWQSLPNSSGSQSLSSSSSSQSLPSSSSSQSLSSSSRSQSSPKSTVNASAALPIRVENVRFAQLNAWGRILSNASISAKPQGDAWSLDLDSQEFKGHLDWQSADNKLVAQIDKLWLPFPLENKTAVKSAKAPLQANAALDDPRQWPAVKVNVADLRYQKVMLGALALETQPKQQSMEVKQLRLKNADGEFNLEGAWAQQGGVDKTQGKVTLNSPNLGKLLARLGYPEAMAGALFQMNGTANWQGAPWAPDLASLQGHFSLDVGAGHFLQLDPGAGRFLSVLNLQAIPRRLKLDFDDVISKGFAFDRITGNALMDKGVARTTNLLIDGPAAKVRFKGDANFVAGTQNLNVKIVPVLGDTVALGVAVINPLAGLATFAAQRMFDQDPLGELVAFEYQIDGAMSDPQVKKIR